MSSDRYHQFIAEVSDSSDSSDSQSKEPEDCAIIGIMDNAVKSQIKYFELIDGKKVPISEKKLATQLNPNKVNTSDDADSDVFSDLSDISDEEGSPVAPVQSKKTYIRTTPVAPVPKLASIAPGPKIFSLSETPHVPKASKAEAPKTKSSKAAEAPVADENKKPKKVVPNRPTWRQMVLDALQSQSTPMSYDEIARHINSKWRCYDPKRKSLLINPLCGFEIAKVVSSNYANSGKSLTQCDYHLTKTWQTALIEMEAKECKDRAERKAKNPYKLTRTQRVMLALYEGCAMHGILECDMKNLTKFMNTFFPLVGNECKNHFTMQDSTLVSLRTQGYITAVKVSKKEQLRIGRGQGTIKIEPVVLYVIEEQMRLHDTDDVTLVRTWLNPEKVKKEKAAKEPKASKAKKEPKFPPYTQDYSEERHCWETVHMGRFNPCCATPNKNKYALCRTHYKAWAQTPEGLKEIEKIADQINVN